MSEKLDTGVVKILSAKIGDLIRSDLREIEMEASRIYTDYARRNIVSPMALRQVADMCCEHIRKRSEEINELLVQLSVRGVLCVNSENKEEIFNIVRDNFVSDLRALKKTTERPLLGTYDPTMYFDAAISDGLERMGAEIDVLSFSRTPDPISSTQTITLYNYGTIGAIQSGTDMTANVNQEIEAKRDGLIAALENLRAAISADVLPNAIDIVDTINDGIKELGQEKVNNFRLQGHIMMLMTTLQTLPNLKPAIAVLAQAYDYYFGTNTSSLLQ